MNNQNTNRRELFDNIGAISFALDDLRLFLDTHPDCAEALSLFTEYMTLRHELMAKYTTEFGPIDSYYPGTDNGWTWNKGPMPTSNEVN